MRPSESRKSTFDLLAFFLAVGASLGSILLIDFLIVNPFGPSDALLRFAASLLSPFLTDAFVIYGGLASAAMMLSGLCGLYQIAKDPLRKKGRPLILMGVIGAFFAFIAYEAYMLIYHTHWS